MRVARDYLGDEGPLTWDMVWHHLPPMAQRAILEVSASGRITIPSYLSQSLHQFLNARNATALQADCALTYAGQNLYLLMYFLQALLQGHILVIPDLDAPAGLPPLLTLPSSAGPANVQQ